MADFHINFNGILFVISLRLTVEISFGELSGRWKGQRCSGVTCASVMEPELPSLACLQLTSTAGMAT